MDNRRHITLYLDVIEAEVLASRPADSSRGGWVLAQVTEFLDTHKGWCEESHPGEVIERLSLSVPDEMAERLEICFGGRPLQEAIREILRAQAPINEDREVALPQEDDDRHHRREPRGRPAPVLRGQVNAVLKKEMSLRPWRVAMLPTRRQQVVFDVWSDSAGDQVRERLAHLGIGWDVEIWVGIDLHRQTLIGVPDSDWVWEEIQGVVRATAETGVWDVQGTHHLVTPGIVSAVVARRA